MVSRPREGSAGSSNIDAPQIAPEPLMAEAGFPLPAPLGWTGSAKEGPPPPSPHSSEPKITQTSISSRV